MNTRKAYPTDLTDTQWWRIHWLLPHPRVGRTPLHSRRDMLDAVLYVTRTGCQWRQLPHDFPPWSAVYAFFRRLTEAGVWTQVNEALRPEARRQAGRASQPSLVLIDSQSVQTAEKRGRSASTGTSSAKAANGKSRSIRWAG